MEKINEEDFREDYIICVLEEAGSTADKVCFDMNNDTHREILDGSFGTSMGTWLSLSVNEARSFAYALLKAVDAKAMPIESLDVAQDYIAEEE